MFTSPCCDESLELVSTRADTDLGVTVLRCPECGQRYELVQSEPEPPLPAIPTKAPAGSEEKIATMAARLARGEALFHPEDNLQRERAPSAQTGGGVDPRVRAVNRELPAGVSWLPRRRKYRARLWDPATKKHRHLGLFATAAQASQAVERARMDKK